MMAEAVLALYKITKDGKMMRHNSITMNMGKKFFPSRDGNMTLTRSKDKKVFSVINFDQENKLGEYFKLMAWTNKLDPFHFNPEINQHLSLYFNGIKEHFEYLEEVAFVVNNSYIKMSYVEMCMRPLKEQKEYDFLMADQTAGKDEGKFINNAFSDSMNPRRCRKHAFFNTKTGKKVWEYGGVKDCLEVTNCNGKQVKVYEMAMLFKEIQEKAYKPYIMIVIAGDFLPDHMKAEQIVHNWAMVTVMIESDKLFKAKGPDMKNAFVRDKILAAIPCQENHYNLENLYCFNPDLIMKNEYDW